MKASFRNNFTSLLIEPETSIERQALSIFNGLQSDSTKSFTIQNISYRLGTDGPESLLIGYNEKKSGTAGDSNNAENFVDRLNKISQRMYGLCFKEAAGFAAICCVLDAKNIITAEDHENIMRTFFRG